MRSLARFYAGSFTCFLANTVVFLPQALRLGTRTLFSYQGTNELFYTLVLKIGNPLGERYPCAPPEGGTASPKKGRPAVPPLGVHPPLERRGFPGRGL